MVYLKILFITGLLILAYPMIGQKTIISQADKYYERGKYAQAAELYDQVDRITENRELISRRGISNYYVNNYNQALKDLTFSYTLGNKDAEVFLYAGKSLQSLGKYEEAAEFYKDYLHKEKNKESRQKIIEEIKKLGYAHNMQYADQLAYVENIGPSVNSSADEISPVQSPNMENKYYFSSNREGSTGGLRDKNGYRDDVYGQNFYDLYGVELKSGNWSSIIAFDPILNGPKNDIMQGFSNKGNVLFYMKTLDMESGILLTDTFRMDRPSDLVPKRFDGPISCESGDRNIQVFDDNTILFSSNRTGGYGGYDIYVTRFYNNEWSTPYNLGPKINTPYNELDPFLTNSGTKIYFSSDRLDGYGGYDIFTNSFGLETRKWGATENMGLPVNSPNSDRYFSLSSDGQTGILSSDRDGTLGGFDIYTVYLKDLVAEQKTFTSSLPFLIFETDTIAIIDETISPELEVTEEISSAIVTNERKDLYIKDLYYGDDENVLNPSNLVAIKSIIDLMKVYPETEVILSGNSIIEGLAEFDLFFSIKRSEKVAEYMVKNGIAPNRIYTKGLGSNYPLVQMSNINISRTAKVYNRRIEISVIENGENIKVTKEKPNILANILDPRSGNYASTINGLSYKINFATVKQMYKGDVIKDYPGATIEKRMDESLYTYSIGIFNTFTEARSIKNELLRDNIMEAKIQPYLDGVKIMPYEIDLFSAKYPDLKVYKSFE